MYAVIQSGGKQYRVAIGDRFKVESLKLEPGASVALDQVLMLADGDDVKLGTPTVDTKVEATVIGHGRGDKIRILKFRRRKNSRTHGGHRQHYTELEVTGIGGKTAAPKAKPTAKKKDEEDEPKKSTKKVAKKTAAKASAKKTATKKTTKKKATKAKDA